MAMRMVMGARNTSSPPNLGGLWGALGDSHNFGYGSSTCLTPFHAFCRIWQTKVLPGPTNPYTNIRTGSVYQNGESGRSLGSTYQHYSGWSGRTNRTFLCFQESGDQAEDGQRTAAQFGSTWDGFVDAIGSNTGSCTILYETAYNFGRDATANRNWATYNDLLRERIAARNLPNRIFLCETDRDIKLLGSAIGTNNVYWQSAEANPYHFKSVGNLQIALGYFKAMRYNNITLADLADIGTGVVSEAWQQVCLDIYNAN